MKRIRIELPWCTWNLLCKKARQEGRSCSSVVDHLIWEDRRRWWDETWRIVLSRLYPNQERSVGSLTGRPQEPPARVEKHDA